MEGKTGKTELEFSGAAKGSYFSAFSPDGRYLASSLIFSNQITIWDTKTKKTIRVLEGHLYGTRLAAFSRQKNRLVSYGSDGKIRLWDTATGKPVRTHALAKGARVTEIALSPRGEVAFVRSARLYVWDSKSDKVREIQSAKQP